MWRNPQESADLITFTEEILNGNLQCLRSERYDFEIILSIFSKLNINI